MQTLFLLSFPGRREQEDPIDVLRRAIEEQGKDQVDAAFAESLLQGVLEHETDILRIIQEHAPQWPLERMETIARALLMIGTYEILYATDAPPAVAMNEAIDIAKTFGEEESGKFVNGVLNAIAHNP